MHYGQSACSLSGIIRQGPYLSTTLEVAWYIISFVSVLSVCL